MYSSSSNDYLTLGRMRPSSSNDYITLGSVAPIIIKRQPYSRQWCAHHHQTTTVLSAVMCPSSSNGYRTLGSDLPIIMKRPPYSRQWCANHHQTTTVLSAVMRPSTKVPNSSVAACVQWSNTTADRSSIVMDCLPNSSVKTCLPAILGFFSQDVSASNTWFLLTRCVCQQHLASSHKTCHASNTWLLLTRHVCQQYLASSHKICLKQYLDSSHMTCLPALLGFFSQHMSACNTWLLLTRHVVWKCVSQVAWYWWKSMVWKGK